MRPGAPVLLGLLLLAQPVRGQEWVRLVQIGPEGEPLLGFDFACDEARCHGRGVVVTDEGELLEVEGEALLRRDRAFLALRVPGRDISTDGAVPMPLRARRGVAEVRLVEGWRADPTDLREAVRRHPAPAGITLRAAFGP